MPDRLPSKTLLRAQMRRRRRRLSPAGQLAAAESAPHHLILLPRWPDAHRIALYLANDGEVDTQPISAHCRAAGKQLFLPVIDEQSALEFAEWTADAELVTNRYGISEPAPNAPRCAASVLDIVIVPLVAWDRRGGRVGMGGGFYDRALAGVEGPLLVGLAHALQEVPRVPCDDWDVSLDFVVTETALHNCQGKN